MVEAVLQGACLCKAVTVQATAKHDHVEACHCSMCRTWGGGPLLTVACESGARWGGEEHIGIYDSSEWAQRGFCRQCGTHLFYRLKDGGLLALPAGLLENTDDFVFTQQVFIDEKPANYRFANETKNLTGEEVFALFQSDA